MYISTELDVRALPKLLSEGAKVAQTAPQCDMLLLSLLTASGYAMPHYFVRHGQPAHVYHPSLMTMVIAPPASGKGILNLGKKVLQPLHEERRAMAAKEKELEELTGIPAREYMAFLPANSSSNAFLHLLHDNDGRALMMETEMDVLSGVWKRDYGNYSAAFRQAFEHETISKARKMRGEELIEVLNPSLSVLLSGTMNQLEPLLRSRENGLASRFLCYKSDEIVPFIEESILKYDERQEDDVEAIYTRLGQELLTLEHWLCSHGDKNCEFRLTPEQSQMLRDYFHDGYLLTLGDMQMPVSFDPVVKRLVVSALRIAMILRMLHYFEDEVQERLKRGEKVDLPEVLVCSDDDFSTMIQFVDVLLCHAVNVHESLPTDDARVLKPQEVQPGKQQTEALAMLNLLPKQFTTKEAMALGQTQNMGTKRTIQRCIQRLLDGKKIARVSQGVYVKI